MLLKLLIELEMVNDHNRFVIRRHCITGRRFISICAEHAHGLICWIAVCVITKLALFAQFHPALRKSIRQFLIE